MKRKIFGVALLALVLGVYAGAAVWVILKVMQVAIDLLWETIPQALGMENSLIYNLAICSAGGLAIGLYKKKYGVLPDNLHDVMHKVKKDGTYPYDNLQVVAFAALLPLVFGGALGPEAGLSGIVVGLCCFVTDRLKDKGDQLMSLSDAKMTDILKVVFKGPVFRVDRNQGEQPTADTQAEPRQRLVNKATRIFLYLMIAVGAVAAVKVLTYYFGIMGIPRFESRQVFEIEQWLWFIPLLATGLLGGFIYLLFNKCTMLIGKKLQNHTVIACVLAGIVIAIFGYLLPLTMFSGEYEMEDLMLNYQSYTIGLLILTAVGKLFLVTLCLNLGWRGGNIFPIIFSGVAIGFAVAAIIGIDSTFAVPVVTATLFAYIMRKPLAVVALLLLCFPVSYIIPMLAAAWAASKIPLPKMLAAE